MPTVLGLYWFTPHERLPVPLTAAALRRSRRWGLAMTALGVALFVGAMVLSPLLTRPLWQSGLFLAVCVSVGLAEVALSSVGLTRGLADRPEDAQRMLDLCACNPAAATYRHRVLAQGRPLCVLDLRLVERHPGSVPDPRAAERACRRVDDPAA